MPVAVCSSVKLMGWPVNPARLPVGHVAQILNDRSLSGVHSTDPQSLKKK